MNHRPVVFLHQEIEARLVARSHPQHHRRVACRVQFGMVAGGWPRPCVRPRRPAPRADLSRTMVAMSSGTPFSSEGCAISAISSPFLSPGIRVLRRHPAPARAAPEPAWPPPPNPPPNPPPSASLPLAIRERPSAAAIGPRRVLTVFSSASFQSGTEGVIRPKLCKGTSREPRLF